VLSKKHGQLKQAITKMVQVVMSFLDDTPDMETKLRVIETLRIVTEGKVSHFSILERMRRWLTAVQDLCRGRTSAHNTDPVRYQKTTR